MPSVWKTVRVFIASTFRDMHAERDHLIKFVFPALREQLAKEPHHSPFCFVTKTGNHISKSNLTRQVFRPFLKPAKLARVKFHALRHSHLSALPHEGASIKAVGQRLGHSTVELTLRVYLHLLPNADDSLAGMTDKLFT
jgi:integrase